MPTDYFLKCTTWKGESKQKGHTDEVEILSWKWGGAQPWDDAGSSGHAIGKVKMAPLVITKHVDKASAQFLIALAKGSHVDTAILRCFKATGTGKTEEYLTIKLTEVFVSKYELGGGAPPDATAEKAAQLMGSREEVTLQYNKIEYDYKAQGGDGSLTAAGTFGYSATAGEVT